MSLFATGILENLDAQDISEQTDRVQLVHGKWVSLDEAARRVELSPIIKRFGTWAVTEYGVECLTTPYAIPKHRLGEQDWLKHMHGKVWILFEDFRDAFATAQRFFARSVKPAPTQTTSTRERHRRRQSLSNRVKFLVLRRDNYRCQLCGRKAIDGVQIDIDHKVALANGGTNDIENLWALCHPCNNGKSTLEL